MSSSNHGGIPRPSVSVTAGSTLRELVIEGLIKAHHDDQNPEGYGHFAEAYDENSEKFSVSLTCSEDEPVTDLWKRLRESGYIPPQNLTREDKEYFEHSYKFVVGQHEEVVVVGDNEPSGKNSIRLNERLIAHANAYHGKAQIYEVKDKHSGDSIESNRTIDDARGFQMSIERTPRMPDDDKLHQLPGSLGSCELYNVNAYSDRLPKNIVDEGGVFFAMWQREALWLNFKSRFGKRFAVRVFMGHVNAISGLNMEEQKSEENKDEAQDYVVIPGQNWLDGICVAPGVVRQFVAMPLGSGYTVEGQKTSEEKHGGLQIEIIPEYDNSLRCWRKDDPEQQGFLKDGTPTLINNAGLLETSTPEMLKCKVGDVFRTYPEFPKHRTPFSIEDLIGTQEKATFKANYPPRRHYYPTRMADYPHGGSERDRERRYSGRPMIQCPCPPTKEHFIVSKRAEEISAIQPDSHESVTLSCSKDSDFDNGDKKAGGVLENFDFDSFLHADSTENSLGTVGGYISDEYDDVDMGFGVDFDREDPEDTKLDPTLETRDLKSMGLAAGGKLIQDIYKDNYEANIWNHNAARIIHIHILDPISCEKVTHIVPRPPPGDAKAYAEAGGQFYVVEEKVDERLDGGDFDNVKSVSQMDKHIGITTEPEFDPSKPKMCTTCEVRLCDCIIRPCDHQFCNVCIKKLEREGEQDPILARKYWKCPTCNKEVTRVAGFSAPMNLPGEEPMRMKVPVNVLKIEDGRVRFSSIQKTRI